MSVFVFNVPPEAKVICRSLMGHSLKSHPSGEAGDRTSNPWFIKGVFIHYTTVSPLVMYVYELIVIYGQIGYPGCYFYFLFLFPSKYIHQLLLILTAFLCIA